MGGIRGGVSTVSTKTVTGTNVRGVSSTVVRGLPEPHWSSVKDGKIRLLFTINLSGEAIKIVVFIIPILTETVAV